jgi:hypothetical protein
MQTIPFWLQQAFMDWLTGSIYLDRRGNYRSRIRGRRVLAYNRILKHVYRTNDAFHRAAHRWLELWEAVPTSKLRQSLRDHP